MAGLLQSISLAVSTASTAEVAIVTAISLSLAVLLYVLQRYAEQLRSVNRRSAGGSWPKQTGPRAFLATAMSRVVLGIHYHLYVPHRLLCSSLNCYTSSSLQLQAQTAQFLPFISVMFF